MTENRHHDFGEEENADLETITMFCDTILDSLEPKAKAVIRRVEQLKRDDQRNWPSWCYAPSDLISEEINRYDPLLTPAQLGEQTIYLQAALSWMNQRYVARCAPSILHRTEDGADRCHLDIPAARLLKLPGHALFVESGGILTIGGVRTTGHLVYLNYLKDWPPMLNVLTFAAIPGTEDSDHLEAFPVPHVLPLIDNTYLGGVMSLIERESIAGVAAPTRAEIANNASHVSKIAALVSALPVQDMDLREHPLKEDGDFGFPDEIRVIEVAESKRYLN